MKSHMVIEIYLINEFIYYEIKKIRCFVLKENLRMQIILTESIIFNLVESLLSSIKSINVHSRIYHI